MHRSLCALALWALWLSSPQAQTTAEEVSEILKAKTPPAGVVFEIAEDYNDFFDIAIPEINKYIKQLRRRFPNLEIAIVSHGSEMFLLKKQHLNTHSSVHSGIRRIVEKDKIPVHVCGTYAEWYQSQPEDFPSYVDVTPSGPVQLNHYQELGYQRIRLEID